MPAFYNEIEPYAAQWTRNLIAAGHVAPGTVDERSIKDLKPSDLAGYSQCHFFAGIAVWSYALRLAGVPDEFSVWTGSCPCQPFSGAGKRGGFNDERHLWPTWFELIKYQRPQLIFGEQVASKDGLAWLDLVSSDLEGAGYAFWAADLCAAGVGAPHIRQRLYWVAYSADAVRRSLNVYRQDGRNRQDAGREEAHGIFGTRGKVRPVADSHEFPVRWDCGAAYREEAPLGREDRQQNRTIGDGFKSACGVSCTDALVNPSGLKRAEGRLHSSSCICESRRWPQSFGSNAGQVNGFWSDAEWLQCLDGKARPTQSGLLPLAYGSSCRVGRLRAYGNAIVGELAAAFIASAFDAIREVIGGIQ